FRCKVQAFALGAGVAGLAGILFAHYLAYVGPNMFLPPESLFVWLALILGGRGNNRGALPGSVVRLGLPEGSRCAARVIPFLSGVRLAAAQQILVGVVLVVLMIRRPEGLLPEKPGGKGRRGAARRSAPTPMSVTALGRSRSSGLPLERFVRGAAGRALPPA